MPTYDPRLEPFLAPAIRSHAKFYPRGPFISITLAQLILESAWGTATSGRNNYFGIKGHPPTATLRWTHETIAGRYVKIPQWFADFDSIESCFDAHAHLLTTSHYQRCIDAATPDAYAHALWYSGYATGIPGHPYDEALIALMRAHNLYQFDVGAPAAATSTGALA